MWRRMGFELDVRLLGKLLSLSSRVILFLKLCLVLHGQQMGGSVYL
jgi:hypothetical protein